MFKESKLGTLSALEQDTFLRIMMRESGMNPNVKPGDQGETKYDEEKKKWVVTDEKAPKEKWSYGLFQIRGINLDDPSSTIKKNMPHIKKYSDLSDPKNNMEAAYWLYKSRQSRYDKNKTKYDGFLPWAVQLGGGISEYGAHKKATAQYDLSDEHATGHNRRIVDTLTKEGIVRPNVELSGREVSPSYDLIDSKPAYSGPGYAYPDLETYEAAHGIEGEEIVDEVVDEVAGDDKYQIPKEKSKIPAWMKKHGWKGSDIGKMVDGRWKGYHPGDTMAPKEEKESGVGTAGAESYLETEEVPEEALELARLREPGGYEDPLGGDTVDDPLTFSKFGPVKRYFAGGPSLTAGEGGGASKFDPEYLWTLSSREIIDWRNENRPILTDEEELDVDKIVGRKKDAEKKFEPHAGSQWGGEKFRDPTGVGASFEEIETVEYDEKGKPVPTEEMKEDAYRSMRGLPTPGASDIHPSQEQHVAGVPESELTPLDPTKDPSYSVMERTVEGKEPGAKIEKTKKVEKRKAPPKSKVKSQAEIDAEQEVASAKEDAAWLKQQREAIAAQIHQFNNEQEGIPEWFNHKGFTYILDKR